MEKKSIVIESSEVGASELEKKMDNEKKIAKEEWISKYNSKALAETIDQRVATAEDLRGHKFDTATKQKSMQRITSFLDSLGGKADGYRALQAALFAR